MLGRAQVIEAVPRGRGFAGVHPDGTADGARAPIVQVFDGTWVDRMRNPAGYFDDFVRLLRFVARAGACALGAV